MKNPSTGSGAAALLRRKAESLLKKKASKTGPHHTESEMLKLIHELEVHQIELEMQNDELLLAKAAAQDAVELYDFAPSGYFTLSKDRTIANLNLCGARMLGKERLHLINSSFGFFVSSDTKPVFDLFFEKAFKSHARESCEVKLSTRRNLPVFVLLSGIVTEDREQCLVTCVDISERRWVEEEIRKAQKLESLGVLAGGIAHDFNNLLCGIFGYIEISKELCKDPVVSRYLARTINRIDRARALTQQLLAFARGGTPIRKITPLFPFVRETVQFALSGSNVSCRFNAAEGLWPCSIDINQIGQVIENIIFNAKQAMPNGGTIELMALNITPAEKHPALANGNYVKVSIRDHGVGIPEKIMPRIFDPFFTTKANGHGLGLATCYSIINRHGGCIDVKSAPGKGSTFHVYLPASSETGSVDTTTIVKHKGSGTIIVMDDEEANREVFGVMLKDLGYSVFCTKDGKDALKYFNKNKAGQVIAGLIFDSTVPGGMGGPAAVEEIRKTYADAKIPVFAASGYADDPVMKNPAEYGFTASICKPFRKSELTEMLEKHLKK